MNTDVDKQSRIEKSVACLSFGAIGDALGAPIEFMKMNQIRELYGEIGLTEFASEYGVLGPVTDDTQMTLFAADSLINAYRRGSERGILAPYWTYTTISYIDWLQTQGQRNSNYSNIGFTSKELYELVTKQGQRAPGTTCITALSRMPKPSEFATNDSKGCGTVMRVAPIGIFFGNMFVDLTTENLKKIYEHGAEDAKITHGHPVAADASGMLACIIALCLQGTNLLEALNRSLELSTTKEVKTTCSRAIELANNPPTSDVLSSLGEGWIAEEALAIAIYCALQFENNKLSAKEALLLAVNHDGDSDSTGAVAGNLIGISSSPEIPNELLNPESEVGSLMNILHKYGEKLISVKDYRPTS